MFKDSLTDVVEEVMHSLASQKMEVWDSFKEKNDKGKQKKVKRYTQ